jgi:hypothetical protein
MAVSEWLAWASFVLLEYRMRFAFWWLNRHRGALSCDVHHMVLKCEYLTYRRDLAHDLWINKDKYDYARAHDGLYP